jgi:pantetheine-phosphate adenylyltransferase
VIERIAGMFSHVVVLVLGNPAKAHLLSIDERIELVAASTAHLGNVRAAGHQGLTADGARAVGAGALVRNAGKELEVERTMAAANQRFAGLPTLLVASDPTTATISSTIVRSLLRHGQHDDIEYLVPPAVHHALTGLQSRSPHG